MILPKLERNKSTEDISDMSSSMKIKLDNNDGNQVGHGVAITFTETPPSVTKKRGSVTSLGSENTATTCTTTTCRSNSARSFATSARFPMLDEDLCEYSEKGRIIELNESLCEIMWYSEEDYYIFRRQADRDSREAIRKGLDVFIEKTYGYKPISVTVINADQNDEGKKGVNTDVKREADPSSTTKDENEISLKKQASAQKALVFWSKCKDTRRGLERFISKEYAKRRSIHRKRQIHSVMVTQKKLREENVKDPIRIASIIAQVLEGMSTESTNFAMMLGRADFEALQTRQQQHNETTSSEGGPTKLQIKRKLTTSSLYKPQLQQQKVIRPKPRTSSSTTTRGSRGLTNTRSSKIRIVVPKSRIRHVDKKSDQTTNGQKEKLGDMHNNYRQPLTGKA